MQRKPSRDDRLLVLTLMLEAAVEAQDWAEVKNLLNLRADLIEGLGSTPNVPVREIGVVEERILTTLRKRVGTVRADLRNLTTALRIAAPYARAEHHSSLCLAG